MASKPGKSHGANNNGLVREREGDKGREKRAFSKSEGDLLSALEAAER